MVCFYSKEINSVHSPSPISSLSLFYIYFSGLIQRCFPGTTDHSLKFARDLLSPSSTAGFLSGFREKKMHELCCHQTFYLSVFISSGGWHRRARSRGMQRNTHTKF
ncbi:hypothetical protein CEXT_418591 [Caerostris extrusa]|uniref:Uncharacterized protein n=1 Tax=Caerostris extrusa TaxID=172846 RepID=A0AAV4NWC7_CAEEX|nr:hypothetical protein CEXT_418591 [Caerostris extrusa]